MYEQAHVQFHFRYGMYKQSVSYTCLVYFCKSTLCFEWYPMQHICAYITRLHVQPSENLSEQKAMFLKKATLKNVYAYCLK